MGARKVLMQDVDDPKLTDYIEQNLRLNEVDPAKVVTCHFDWRQIHVEAVLSKFEELLALHRPQLITLNDCFYEDLGRPYNSNSII